MDIGPYALIGQMISEIQLLSSQTAGKDPTLIVKTGLSDRVWPIGQLLDAGNWPDLQPWLFSVVILRGSM